MIDLPSAEIVEILIDTDRSRLGTRLWAHADNNLVLRIYRIGKLVVDDRSQNSAVAAIRHVLQRCNDNGGEIDAELVAELKAAIGEERR